MQNTEINNDEPFTTKEIAKFVNQIPDDTEFIISINLNKEVDEDE